MAVNLKKSYAKLNEKIASAFDGMGVRRSFTIPYVEGHSMADHVNAIAAVAQGAGGISSNFLNSYHRDGKWGSGDGETSGHPVDKLRTTIIPKSDPAAKEAIEAAQSHLDNFKKLLGSDDADVATAQHQLNLVKRTDGAGMNLFDFGVLLQQIMFKPTQKVVRLHSLANADTPVADMESGLGSSEGQNIEESASGATPEAQAGSEAPEAGAAQTAPPAGAAPQGGAPQAAPAPVQQ